MNPKTSIPAGFVPDAPDGFIPDAPDQGQPQPMMAAHEPEHLNTPLNRSDAAFLSLLTAGMGFKPVTPGTAAAVTAPMARALPAIASNAPLLVPGAGIPARIALGGAGGAAGGAARDFLLHSMGQPTPQTPGGEALSIAKEGGLGAGLQGMGEGLSALAGRVSPPLMAQALRVTQRLEREFPQVAFIREALERGINVNPGDLLASGTERQATSSSGRLRQAALRSAENADNLLSEATARTRSVPDVRDVPHTTTTNVVKPGVPRLVPKTVLETRSVPANLQETAPIGDVASVFRDEVQSHAGIHDAAEKLGMDPDALMEIIRNPKPRTEDLVVALRDHGLTAPKIAELRETYLPGLERADNFRSAMMEVVQPHDIFELQASPDRVIPTTTTIHVPTVVGTKDVPALRYSANDLTEGVSTLLSRMRSSTAAGADRAEVQSYLEQFLADHPGALTPTEANDIKQFAQTASKSAIAGRNAGERTVAQNPNWQLFNDAIQRTIRQRLEQDVAGLAGANKETQALLGLSKAFRAAESRMGPPLTHPVEALSWHLGASPAALSRLANVSADPAVQAALRNNLLPRAVVAGIEQINQNP